MADTNEPKLAPPQRKKKATRAYLVLAGLAGAILAIYFIHGYLTKDEVATDDAQTDADVVPVSARVSGVVLKMHVQDNQEVKAGQLIAEIDPADYTAKVTAAEANLAAAQAQAEAADAQVGITTSTSRGGLSSAKAMQLGASAAVAAAGSQIAAAQAAVARAKSDLAKANGDYDRAKKLHDAGAITGQQMDAATAARDSAKAALDLANANLAAARDAQAQAQTHVAEAKGHVEQSAPIDQQIAAANASSKLAHAHVDSAKAALDIAKLEASYTKIVAPSDGFVSKLAVHDGQMVQPGSVICMVVPKATYVIANFKETQISRIRPGDDVEIKIDAIGGTRHGKVVSVAAGTGARFSMMPPDNATGNFVKVVQRVPVKINWATPQDGVGLQAGLSADVTVHLQ
jgi:membrane fusion protein (multidrug efflux system)